MLEACLVQRARRELRVEGHRADDLVDGGVVVPGLAREEPRSAHGRRDSSNRTTNSTTCRKQLQVLHAQTSGNSMRFSYSTLCSRCQKLNNTHVNLDGSPSTVGSHLPVLPSTSPAFAAASTSRLSIAA